MSDTTTVFAAIVGAVLLLGGLALGWGARTALDRRAARRAQEFLGLPEGADSVIVTAGPTGGSGVVATWPDVYALLELGALVRGCGSRPALVTHGRMAQGVGARTEFCLGGPPANSRSAAHLEWTLPGVAIGTEPVAAQLPAGTGAAEAGGTAGAPHSEGPADAGAERPDSGDSAETGQLPAPRTEPVFRVAGQVYRGTPGSSEYVLLAKASATDNGRPVFLVCGQTAVAHHAAVRWFADRQRRLARKYGVDGDFTLLLRVVNSSAYGPDVVELAADVTEAARVRPAAAGPAASGPRAAEGRGKEGRSEGRTASRRPGRGRRADG